MSNTWHMYKIEGSERNVIVGCLATAMVRGEELVGSVISTAPVYMTLTRAQNQAINTHGFVEIV